MTQFDLDHRLERDSDLLVRLALCQIRLMKDARWPWLVLVPQRAGIAETFDLSFEDQALLSIETNAMARALKAATGATKINIGALGNIVRQLHVHVIARMDGDINWPGPVWGHGTPEPWDPQVRADFLKRLTDTL